MVNGQPSRIESKYIVDPNYILKNITSGLDKLISRNSLKFYNQCVNSTNLEVPTKFIKLFEIEKNYGIC